MKATIFILRINTHVCCCRELPRFLSCVAHLCELWYIKWNNCIIYMICHDLIYAFFVKFQFAELFYFFHVWKYFYWWKLNIIDTAISDVITDGMISWLGQKYPDIPSKFCCQLLVTQDCYSYFPGLLLLMKTWDYWYSSMIVHTGLAEEMNCYDNNYNNNN